MMRRALVAVVVALQGGGASPSALGARFGYTVEPDTARVGQPATLRVRVQAPTGTRITFAPAVDSTGAVEPLDPVAVTEETRGGLVDATATYRFLAWDVGNSVIPVAPVRLELNGRTEMLSIGEPRVLVASVLPADTALRVPQPARDVVAIRASRWRDWLLIAGGFVVAALLGWWLQRRRQPRARRVEPFVDAQRAFGRLAALDLIGAGEPARHVASAEGIVRGFLAARDGRAALGLTTVQLISVLRDDPAVPVPRVEALLSAADDIKYSGKAVDAPAAETLGAEAARLVAAVHTADVAETH